MQLVNDVSGGLADPRMPRLVAAAGASYVVVHWRGHSHDMYSRAVYADVVGEVRDELARRVDAVVARRGRPGRIVVDPGLGFGKRPEHNWPLLAHLADVGVLAGRHLPGPGRGVAEALPRPPAGRPGRHAEAVRRLRRGHGRDHGAGRRGGRLVRAGAPGSANADAVRVAAAWRAGPRPARRSDGHRPVVSRRRRVVLAVGSNLGDRLGTLQGCVQAIGRLPDTDVLAISPVYETAPVGGPAQPDYLNAVLIVATGLPPLDLLAAAHRIEADFGRVRTERFGPRTLDIDIISYAARSATTRC